jgi:hypothetical protein
MFSPRRTREVDWIDELLASLSDYGELPLISQHADLRYINKVESYRASDRQGAKPAEGVGPRLSTFNLVILVLKHYVCLGQCAQIALGGTA